MKLTRYFTPSQISKVYIVGGVVVFFVGAVMVMNFMESDKPQRKIMPTVQNIITDRNSREFGLDAVNDQVIVQKKELIDTQKEVDRLNTLNQKLNDKLNTYENNKTQQSQMESDLEDLVKKMGVLETQLNESKAEVTAKYQPEQPNDTSVKQANVQIKHPELAVNPERRTVRNASFSYGDQTATNTGNESTHLAKQSTQVVNEIYAERRQDGLFTFVESDVVSQEPKKEEIYLPKGSILTGVLITGLDAPTSNAASETPIPVLVRIKKEAILPNYATLREVDECFALMAGYGDLSSERAMLRGESITCVRKDKTIIEADFKGYAVGEDGKNGLKGTLVTRNSAVLANAMMAGFASGLSSMFNVSPVPLISTDTTGQQQYQDVFSTEALQGGAAKGASDAMDRLTDYYMDLADAIHPVIEVGGGRVLDMVVTTGTAL